MKPPEPKLVEPKKSSAVPPKEPEKVPEPEPASKSPESEADPAQKKKKKRNKNKNKKKAGEEKPSASVPVIEQPTQPAKTEVVQKIESPPVIEEVVFT